MIQWLRLYLHLLLHRYRVQDTDTGYRIQGTGYRVQDTDTGFKIQDSGYR